MVQGPTNMEHLPISSLLAMWSSHLSIRVLYLGSRAYRCGCAILVAGIASGCQVTNARGDLSKGDFAVTSLRLFTDTGLGVIGPGGTGINLTSNPNAQMTEQLIQALVAVASTRIPPRLQAPEINAND